MNINVTFCGAASTVTGSCYWIEHPHGQFLVDCGLFQGTKTVKELNYNAFPFDATKIDFVLLTHAHIDHSGLIPKLVKQGFDGPIYVTEPTRDLLTFMLPDSAHIQETEVERLNRRNRQRGRPTVEPIYARRDVERSLTQFRVVDYEEWTNVGKGIRAQYWNAGHILGSASIELEILNGTHDQRTLRLLFSGDLGPEHKLFHPDPEAPEDLDFIFCESTYGGRQRKSVTTQQRRAILADEVQQALARGGNLVIPAFAVERTQELLLDLHILLNEGAFPNTTVFLDSPMAVRATSVFAKYAGVLEDVSGELVSFSHSRFHFTESVEESKRISRFRNGAIILAASGMCDAGRIRHHLKQFLPDSKSTVLLVGYQAPGSIGHLIANGVKRIRIHGEEVSVRASIRVIDVYSAHADQKGLIDWVLERRPPKRGLFLTHGEDEEREALRDALVETGLSSRRVFIPQLDDVFDLLGHGGPQKQKTEHRLSAKVIGKEDWHNGYAEFVLDVQQSLRDLADDKQRDQLLRRLRRALDR
jgi:metallo-beta-lactamase family protein